MKHVEFLGIPGAGKSTLCEYLVESLQANGQNAYDINEAAYCGLARRTRVPYVQRSTGRIPARATKRVLKLINKYTDIEQEYLRQFLVGHPDLMALIFRHISKNAPTAERKKLYTEWFCRTISRYELANQHLTEDEMLLFDEGFANRSMTLFHYHGEMSDEDVREYADQIPQPDVLIIPKVPLQVACDRMSQRENGFPPAYAEVDRATRLEILRHNKELVEMTIETLGQQGSEIHHIDNTSEISAVGREIRKILQ